MRIPSPASRGSFAIRFSAFDVFWAFAAPWLALWIRGAQVLTRSDWAAVALFCGIALISSLVGFLFFRIREGMTHLFSVHDALAVAKAVLLSEFVTCLVLFSVTRLDGIPRSTPLIHALLLSAGLVSARAFLRMAYGDVDVPAPASEGAVEHIIVIGSNRLSALYIGMLRAYSRERYRVIAMLDERPEMAGRSTAGFRVLGPPAHLVPVIEEFKEHGIRTDRVIVGGDANFLDPETIGEIRRICSGYQIRLDFIPQLIGLDALQTAPAQSEPMPLRASAARFALPRYLVVKRYIDFCFSLTLIVLLMPLFALIALVVLLDVGSPVYFWQRRIGMDGQSFQMHKFRTLKPSYDGEGNRISSDRMSWIGFVLRKFRLDELPQLLNVLVGDMSLIGPRPLLPHDQPADPTLRLMVRPGITGWAQVNGGKLLTPEEKNALDEWYVRNASLWLDLRIAILTALFLLVGERAAPAKTATAKPTAIDLDRHGKRLA
ncbi:MAG TPA: sugar transferase [Pseudolabrys sp.]|nr:sugar transferase [Pseudolabrys sp.]